MRPIRFVIVRHLKLFGTVLNVNEICLLEKGEWRRYNGDKFSTIQGIFRVGTWKNIGRRHLLSTSAEIVDVFDKPLPRSTHCRNSFRCKNFVPLELIAISKVIWRDKKRIIC
jgi:hypothetical protein